MVPWDPDSGLLEGVCLCVCVCHDPAGVLVTPVNTQGFSSLFPFVPVHLETEPIQGELLDVSFSVSVNTPKSQCPLASAHSLKYTSSQAASVAYPCMHSKPFDSDSERMTELNPLKTMGVSPPLLPTKT